VNEDRAWVARSAGGLTAAVVADGMGGHKAGEVASELAVESLSRSLSDWRDPIAAAGCEDKLREAIRNANTVVYETASGNEEYSNMGTTVVLALLDDSEGLIGHIGDSRAYRLRDGELKQLTEDHTLVNELARSGQLSPEEAARHPRRNVLTRALGTDKDVEVDVQRIDWKPGDRLLLCSDGLSGLVEGHLILGALAESSGDLEQLADRLIALALLAGGDDNVTVALIDYGAEAAAEEGSTP
jgi:protein phosphatase